MKKDYQPKECPICGTTFIPRRFDQVSCGADVCKYKWKNRKLKDRNCKKKRSRKSEFEPYQWKGDTIVAIGYAERQMAETLKMAGKVKV